MNLDINKMFDTAPYLIAPALIFLVLIGVFTVINKAYDLITKQYNLRKNKNNDLINEYDKIINLKDTRILHFERYSNDLIQQLSEIQRVSRLNFELALSTTTVKELTEEDYRDALQTCLWMYERERTSRIIFITIIANSELSGKNMDFLIKHFEDLASLTDANDIIYNSINFESNDLIEEVKKTLKSYYYDLDIDREGDLINRIFDTHRAIYPN